MDPKTLQRAVNRLSLQYRKGSEPLKPHKEIASPDLAARVPATCAVVRNVLYKVPQSKELNSIWAWGWDRNCSLAALKIFPFLNQITLMEHDSEWIPLVNQLETHLPDFQQTTRWNIEDLNTQREFPPHDLIILSYVLIQLRFSKNSIETLRKTPKNYLVFIEPGYPKDPSDFENLLSIILAAGAYLLVPFSQEVKCPLSEEDWCYFCLRLKRPSSPSSFQLI